jgi:hypothetical protein
MRELRQHGDLMMGVMEMRAYEAAYERFHNAKGGGSLPDEGVDPMMDLVWEITAEQIKARGQ